ncbi:sigma-54 dependent transcriptional regulator [uncultured Rikenella sp.]|uniref:sigma-54-dependent transcriptional regulator n=1 Tax=uncultured Rikenella sp. TaxID=368003 RepID=UPI00262363BA|nr:sigma-54 dependent transcriptional regulator [uncultured Rikenella sp.]
MAKILVIDDERSIRNIIGELLEMEGHTVKTAENGLQGYEMIGAEAFDLVISDIKMPEMDGIELLDKLIETHQDITMVMISGHGNIDTAVDCIKKGAFDYIEKPIDMNRLLVTVKNALERGSLVKETKTLRRKVHKVAEIVGESPAIERVKMMIDKVASSDARVLITGSNGTGKELVARWLHEKSDRAAMPFVEVNCAAIPSELIESELFGHEKGAFTSAIKQRKGKFEQADGGTIFLDEIGDMSLAAQAKVLRALQERKITRVGSDKDITVDARVLAATNKNLSEEIAKGNFREDLYHRLSVILIHVPKLADRREDIPLLVNHFIKSICADKGKPLSTITPEAVEALCGMPWTGNIRELHNAVERLLILSGREITLDDVKLYVMQTDE